MKRLLVVAAGEWQLPLIRTAQAEGWFVVATDRNPSAPGLRLADAAEAVDVADWRGNLAVARRYGVDAVSSDQADLAVPTVARVAAALGLPGPGVEAAVACTDKEVMRRRCREAGIEGPASAPVGDVREALRFARRHRWPVVVKPADAQSSRGVRRVMRPAEMAEAVAAARAASRTGRALVEECLHGTELTVEGFMGGDGRLVTLAISEKTHLPPPVCVADSLRYPARLGAAAARDLARLNERVASALGVRMGITHAEFMWTADGPRLVEMANRGGGTRISSDIVPLLRGVDLTRALLRQAAGEHVVVHPDRARAAALEFLALAPGRLRAVDGLDEARRLPGVHALELQVAPGCRIEPVSDDRRRHGYAIVEADTRSECDRRVTALRRTLRFRIDQGSPAPVAQTTSAM